MSKNKLAYLTKDKCFAIETVFYVLLDIVLKNCHMEWHWLILDPLEGAGITKYLPCFSEWGPYAENILYTHKLD